MPPALIYRSADHRVDEVLVAGMPLGGIADFPYRVETVRLSAGDVVLLMSDGFPEMENPDGVLLGYERPRSMLNEWGNLDPQEIVERLTGAAREWGGGSALPDDVTFVVVKVEENGRPS
jgi:serine phosphatase RsbU (regulator of sigma subunit)